MQFFQKQTKQSNQVGHNFTIFLFFKETSVQLNNFK